MSERTDNELMLLVKAGDLDKMGLLFKKHHQSLYRFLFYMTQNREVSEDLVQTVFYRMLKYRRSFTGSAEFTTWIYSIARNVLKDQWKKEDKRRIPTSVEKLNDYPDTDTTGEERLKTQQEHLQLYKAMEQLTKEERELLVLSKFQGLKYREIASILHTSEGAVKVKMHRAVRQLKQLYVKNVCYDM